MRPFRVNRVLIAVIACAGLLTGCGGGGGKSPTPSTDPTRVSTPTPTRTAPSTVSSGIATQPYSDADAGYTLLYPASFHETGRHVATGRIDSTFTNDPASNPMDMGPDGVYVTTRASDNDVQRPLTLDEWATTRRNIPNPAFSVSGRRDLEVDGLPAIQQLEGGDRAQGAFSLSTYILKGDKIYSILMFSYYRAAIESHRADYDVIVNSFKVTN